MVTPEFLMYYYNTIAYCFQCKCKLYYIWERRKNTAKDRQTGLPEGGWGGYLVLERAMSPALPRLTTPRARRLSEGCRGALGTRAHSLQRGSTPQGAAGNPRICRLSCRRTATTSRHLGGGKEERKRRSLDSPRGENGNGDTLRNVGGSRPPSARRRPDGTS